MDRRVLTTLKIDMKTFLEIAEDIAREAHTGQFRRDGKTPYITHPERVVARLKAQGCDEITLATAWLHDVLEDTAQVTDALEERGIPNAVVHAVFLLTRTEAMSYEKYLEWIRDHPIARAVKIADILDNLSDSPSEKQIIKYSKALLYLHGQ